MQANATVVSGGANSDHICNYSITGQITPEDLQIIKQITESQLTKKGGYTQYNFCLDSRGGDLAAAIGIGKEFRRMNAGAIVLHPALCFSSCVFVLAGAVDRSIFGSVGIHRPYAVSTDAKSYEMEQAKYRRMAVLAKTYLAEMNFPERLFDAMNSVPSHRVKILSPAELQDYGLNQQDPVTAEMSNAFNARKYGITKSEMIARKAKSEAVCNKYLANENTIMDYQGCIESVMSGQR